MQKNLGYVVPSIVIDSTTNIGHWYLGPVPLGVRATGTMWSIGKDHYWYCDGAKTDYLAEIPAEEYNEQFQQLMNTYDGTLSKLLTDYQTEYHNWYVTNTTAWQNNFTSWFNNIKLQLDQDVAGHLLNEINGIKTTIGTTDISLFGENITEAIVHLGESVSDGKTLVANAITAKGIETATNASFEVMATNISNIETGKKSLVLPSNPEITDLAPDTGKLDIYWSIPISDIKIDHYNIYTSTKQPTKLSDMQLYGSTTSQTSFVNMVSLNIGTMSSKVASGVTVSVSDGILHLNGTATSNNGVYISSLIDFESGCSYHLAGTKTTIPGSLEVYQLHDYTDDSAQDKGQGAIFTIKKSTSKYLVYWLQNGYTYDNVEIPITLEKIRCKYTLTGLDNIMYYIAVSAVSTEGYENASIAKITSGIIGGLQLVAINYHVSVYCINKKDWYTMLPENTGANDITYGNNEFLAVSATNIYHSVDTKHWTTSATISAYSDRYPLYVTYGDGYFFVLMHNASVPPSIYYSTDGINWTYWSVYNLPTAPADGYEQNGVFCYGKGLIIFGYKNSGLSHCLNFAERTATQITYPTSSIFNPYAVCYSKELDMFVAIGYCSSGAYGGWYSYNGINWYASTSLLNTSFQNMNVHSICYGNDRFIFINYTTAYYSLDGKNWIKGGTLPKGIGYWSITYDIASKCFYAVSGTKAQYTTDGITWVDMNDLPVSCRFVISKHWNE